MVGNAAYAVGLAFQILCNAIDVGVQLPLVFFVDGGFAAVGADDDVVV